MSHEVEEMFSVLETPWHGLGTVVAKAPTAEEAIKLAGLNWRVQLETLFRTLPDGTQIKVPNKAVVRDSDNSLLGVVGPSYTPLQNEAAFKWFNPFIESGECSFETAGSLYNGRRVWVLAKMNRAPIEVVKGDVVNKYILLSNGHDGLMATRAGLTPIRVVCRNTLAMSISNKDSQLIRLKHRTNIVANLDNLREVINTANASFEATKEQYKLLARKDVNQKDLEKYVRIVLRNDKEADNSRAKLKEEALTKRIEELFEVGRGQDIKGVRGTYWALYNATTEYLSYEIGKSQDRRLDGLWFGDLKRKNDLALEVAVKMAEDLLNPTGL